MKIIWKWKVPKRLYLLIACAIAIIILAIPFLLRCPFIYSLIKEYLSVFKSVEYKNTYIGTLGTIFGAFLGVTGAVLAQNIAIERANAEEINKSAQMIICDFEIALEAIKSIVKSMWKDGKKLELREDNYEIAQFIECISKNRFRILPEWRQTLLSISKLLNSTELRQALVFYDTLSQIESVSNNVPNAKYLVEVYSKIFTIIDSDQSSPTEIKFTNEIDQLINKLKIVAE